MEFIASKLVQVDSIRTHYLEAGHGPPLVLLHSGEFGACAELSWEHNIPALARHFHVYAPDWLGYGKTEKVFCFENMRARREHHIAQFLKTMNIGAAHFIGNSMGATELLAAASKVPPPWPMRKIVVVAGGGEVPLNEARKVLNSYDCTRDHMKRIIDVMFVSPALRNDMAYLDRRYRLSLEPGAWECAAAPRFKSPARSRAPPEQVDYSAVRVPVLLVTGEKDPLRAAGFGESLQRLVPGAELCVVPNAGHCPQIEDPTLFNSVVVDFLIRPEK